MIVLHFSQNRGVGWRRETAEESLDLVEPGSGDGSELNVEARMSDFEVLVRPPICEESRCCFCHPVGDISGSRYPFDIVNLSYSSKIALQKDASKMRLKKGSSRFSGEGGLDLQEEIG